MFSRAGMRAASINATCRRSLLLMATSFSGNARDIPRKHVALGSQCGSEGGFLLATDFEIRARPRCFGRILLVELSENSACGP